MDLPSKFCMIKKLLPDAYSDTLATAEACLQFPEYHKHTGR